MNEENKNGKRYEFITVGEFKCDLTYWSAIMQFVNLKEIVLFLFLYFFFVLLSSLVLRKCPLQAKHRRFVGQLFTPVRLMTIIINL